MFKNKMNAYGFMLIVAVWVVFTFLAFFSIPHVGEVAIYLFSLIAFLFFLIALKENKGFAIVGLILSLLPTLGGGLGGGFVAGVAGIAGLFFAFAFIKSESTTLNLLAWALICVFLFTGLFAFWGNVGNILGPIFTGIANILVGGILVYYLATEAGVDIPGNLDEKVKEKIG